MRKKSRKLIAAVIAMLITCSSIQVTAIAGEYKEDDLGIETATEERETKKEKTKKKKYYAIWENSVSDVDEQAEQSESDYWSDKNESEMVVYDKETEETEETEETVNQDEAEKLFETDAYSDKDAETEAVTSDTDDHNSAVLQDDAENDINKLGETEDEQESKEGNKKELTAEGEKKTLPPKAKMMAGTSIRNATRISTGNWYKERIPDYDVDDSNKAELWYKFDLSSSGCVSISGSANIKDLTMIIYDINGTEVWDTGYYWNRVTELVTVKEQIHLIKGTYYLVFKNDPGRSGLYVTEANGGNCSFKLMFSSANESFSETVDKNNNSMSSANAITLGEKYNGQIASNDNNDFYKFVLSKSNTITVTSQSRVDEEVRYRIYNSAGNQKFSEYYYVNDVSKMVNTKDVIDLSAGTYYFAVEQSGSYNTGNYSFRITTPETIKNGFKLESYKGKTITRYYVNGKMITGQKKIGGKWYMFRPGSGSMCQNAFYPFSKKRCYYKSNGQMAYGQKKIKGKWYMFRNRTGAMVKGSFYQFKNKKCYYKSNGQMAYGQKKIKGKWYLFKGRTGAMVRSRFIHFKDKTVYYGNSGQMLYEWQQIKNVYYYFEEGTGALVCKWINDTYYYYDHSTGKYY